MPGRSGAGFEIHEGIVPAAECGRLADALAGPVTRVSAGARHLMRIPAVAELASRSGLLEIARAWLGREPVPYRATFFDKRGARNWAVVWHQDIALPLARRFDDPEWGPWSVKEGVTYAHAPAWALARIVALRVHLDPSTAANGPLRVVPGSHASGVLSDAEIPRRAGASDPVACVVGRGGVLAMSPLILHASSKGSDPAPRRVVHIEYADAFELAPGIRLAVA